MLIPEDAQLLETCLFTGNIPLKNSVFGRDLFSRNLCLCLQCVKIRELLIQKSYKNNIVIIHIKYDCGNSLVIQWLGLTVSLPRVRAVNWLGN